MPDPSWPAPPEGWVFWSRSVDRRDAEIVFTGDVAPRAQASVTYGSDRQTWLPDPSTMRRRRAAALPAGMVRVDGEDTAVRPVRAAGADRTTRPQTGGAAEAGGSSRDTGHPGTTHIRSVS